MRELNMRNRRIRRYSSPGVFVIVLMLTGSLLADPHFRYAETDASHSLLVTQATLDGNALDAGSEIGVFTPAGLCAGGVVWEGERVGLAAWGDDPETEAVDGFRANEEFAFRYWEPQAQQEVAATAQFAFGPSIYTSNGYSRIELDHQDARQHPPRWVNVPNDLVTDVGSVFDFAVEAADSDGDNLELTVNAADLHGYEFTDNRNGTGRFVWQTGANDLGEHQVVFIVNDGHETAEASVRLIVRSHFRYAETDASHSLLVTQATLDGNALDAGSEIGVFTPAGLCAGGVVWEGERVGLAAWGDDPETEAVDGFRANEEFAFRYWEPQAQQEVAATAQFAFGPSIYTSNGYSRIELDHQDARQHPPRWVNVPNDLVTDVGSVFDFAVEAADSDGDNLELTVNAADLHGYEFTDNRNGTGRFVWQTGANDLGEHQVVFIVNDGHETAEASVRLIVRSHFRYAETDASHSLLVTQATLDGNALDAGSEIGVFTPAGLCAGGVVWEGERVGLAAWGDDPETEAVDGFRANEEFAFRYWEPQAQQEVAATAQFAFGPSIYTANGYSRIELDHQGNNPPQWVNLPDSVMADEGALLQIVLHATDPEDDSIRLAMDPRGLPQAAHFADNGDGTGGFSWQIGYDDAGEYSPSFTASDGELSCNQHIRLVINNFNRAPHITQPADADVFRVSVNENEPLRVAFTAGDPDGGELHWTVADQDGLPQGWQFTDAGNGNATFIWTPDFNAGQDQAYTPHFRVTDPGNAIDDIVVEITVREVPRSPVITQPANADSVTVQVDENAQLQVQFTASDPDGGNLTWNVFDDGGVPQGWQFTDHHNGTATYSWTPGYDAARQNPYIPVFQVEDAGHLSDRIRVRIVVLNVNRAPIISQPAESDSVAVEVDENAQLQVQFTASDPDGGNLTWNVFDDGGIPQGWQFTDHHNGTATYSWTPGYDAARQNPYIPVFQVEDADHLNDRIRVLVVVNNVNRAPVLVNAIPDTTAEEDPGRVVVADLRQVFSDPDGDSLTYALSGAPVELGLAIDQGHILFFQPQANFNLPNGVPVTVMAIDSSQRLAQDQFRIAVHPVNDPPTEFDLVAPADGTIIVDYQANFRWQRSTDVDNDSVRYVFSFTFIAGAIDTTFDIPVQDTFLVVQSLDTLVARYGLGDSLSIRWWVSATDGQVVVQSNQRWTIKSPSLSVRKEELLPKILIFEPNYPNPFNPETRIGFSLPAPTDLTVSVWDIRGRMMAMLANGHFNAGRHDLIWRAENVPGGIYLVKMDTPNFSATRKVTLLK